MRFKLDENIPHSSINIVKQYGHDVQTVNFEKLVGSDDKTILEHCKKEERILITCDNDFLNSLQFPLDTFYGLIYLDNPHKNPNKINNSLKLIFDHIPSDEFVARRIQFIEALFDSFPHFSLIVYHQY